MAFSSIHLKREALFYLYKNMRSFAILLNRSLPYKTNFLFSVESNAGLFWFCLTLLCDWSRKLPLFSQAIRLKPQVRAPARSL